MDKWHKTVVAELSNLSKPIVDKIKKSEWLLPEHKLERNSGLWEWQWVYLEQEAVFSGGKKKKKEKRETKNKVKITEKTLNIW